jgi:hypothetical protein
MEDRMVGYCGVICTECPALVGTREKDMELLASLAATWSTPDKQLTPEDVMCDGCATERGRIAACCAGCRVRECGYASVIETCADCGDYPCILLSSCWEKVNMPGAKARLDRLVMARESAEV